MVLYQKRHFPFLVRLLMAIFHPGMLLLLALPGGLFYFAIREHSPAANGMYVGSILIFLFISVAYYFLIKGAISFIVLIESVPEGLRIDQITYDQHNDVIIPTKNIDIKLKTIRSRSTDKIKMQRRRKVSYKLLIIHNGNKDLTFSISGDDSTIGRILDGIEKEKLIHLNATEKEFLEDYRQGLNFSPMFRIALWIVILAFVVYQAYTNWETLQNLFNYLSNPDVLKSK